MKTTMKLLAVVALLLGMFGQASSAAAAEVFRFKGRSASAFFNSIDPSGCFVTSATVGGVEETLRRPPREGSSTGLVFASVSLFNLCTDTRVVNAFGTAPLSKSDLKIAGNLKTVYLTATVNVFDEISGTSFDVFIDLTWTATGDLMREKFHDTVNAEGCHFNVQSYGASRRAQASGTVSDGTINFTPEPSISAIIFSWKGGEVSHGCE
jgi:hypothetical protein